MDSWPKIINPYYFSLNFLSLWSYAYFKGLESNFAINIIKKKELQLEAVKLGQLLKYN